MAKSIHLTEVRKVFKSGGKEFEAIDNLSLDIPAGSFTTIVGPSGCGKTTTLRMLAGLETPTSGQIHFGEEEVTNLRPQERNIAMVFQSIALYPHMSVRENIGYGLKIAGVSQAKRNESIKEAARTLQITDQLDKKPAELSGGQQQRVALGSAFVQNPDVLLLDEPMSDLDAKLKAELRVEVQRLHQELDTTVVYVTHDQTEAMTMSDNVVLLNEGSLEQFDPPKTLFDYPKSEYVARFIGTPSTNVLECRIEIIDGVPTVTGHGLEIPLPNQDLSSSTGDDIKIGIRPQYLSLGTGDHSVEATVEVVEPLGTESVVHARTLDDTRLDIVSDAADDLSPGESITASFDQDHLYFFDADGATRLFGEELTENQSQAQWGSEQ
ncbi:carbohydrate ABC transporter ATP-binding protein, CUT1 family [Haladaptatus litoreus]|uniref:ABC-type D-xylose/L-arabinose transporter n=1 Tax=Haladaptatus litoreus TaxID=553468 RepID=A0A1N7EKI8_9EURY|nr:ABC transporter ATP-binding protein [Haladaptatus litoreus]SIR88616.1 carbohydrate ABC transporter ATP-binding protein, CUT1 family [Haladaptatus litoreus]